MEITGKVLVDFINDKWADSSCPRCGEVNWTGGGPNNLKGLLPLGDDAAASISGTQQALPMIWLVCGTCGHIELIGAKPVRKWIIKRSRESAHDTSAE